MSSVGSADNRNSQDEAIRRARETYQERESDQAKRHSQELKNITEAHRAELREIQELHNRQMEELKSKTQDAMSARDMRYQKEIGELREIQQSTLRRQAQEAENKSKQIDQALRGEIQRVGQTKEQQKQVMAGQYEDQLRQKDRQFEDLSNKARTDSQSANAEIKRKMNEAHEKEKQAIVADRTRQLEEATRDLENVRRVKDVQIGDLEREKRMQNARMSTMQEANMKEQSEYHKQSLEQARGSFDQAITKNRERYQEALQKQSDTNRGALDTFKEDVSDRINNRLTVGEAENQRLKNELARQQADLLRKKNREVQNVRDAMQGNIEQLENARRETVGEANKQAAEDIARAQKRNDDLMSRTNRFFQEKIVTDKMTANERYDKAQADFVQRKQHQEATSENRIAKLKNQNEREETMLRGYFDESSVAQRENFDLSLRELRERNKRDQDMIFKNFADQSMEREAKFQTKLTEVNAKYEKQIQEMRDTSQKSLKAAGIMADREKKQLLDQKNLELQRQASQYENKLAKVEETHRREMEQINRRHQESLENLTKVKGKG